MRQAYAFVLQVRFMIISVQGQFLLVQGQPGLSLQFSEAAVFALVVRAFFVVLFRQAFFLFVRAVVVLVLVVFRQAFFLFMIISVQGQFLLVQGQPGLSLQFSEAAVFALFVRAFFVVLFRMRQAFFLFVRAVVVLFLVVFRQAFFLFMIISVQGQSRLTLDEQELALYGYYHKKKKSL